MSKLSEFLKRQEGNVRGMYDKNLGSFVEKWKRPWMGAGLGAIGAIPGVGMPAALAASAAGIGMGYKRTKEREGQWAAAAEREQQEQARARAGADLQKGYIDPYLPGEGEGENYVLPGEQPNQTPVAVEPPIDPVTGQPQTGTPPANYEQPGIRPDMGNLDVSGAAGRDVGSILDEAERARQMQTDLLTQQGVGREANRKQMAELLNQQMERQFSDQVPGYLEDLNTRGLLRSSALGDRLSTERARMGAGVNEQLAMQALRDSETGIQGMGGIQDQYLQSRQGAMGRRFSLEDYARQTQASKLLGQATAPITPYAGGGKSGTAQAGMAAAGLGLQASQGKGG